MRALVLDRQLKLVANYADPAPVAGESVVRVRLAGICGTDLEIARGYMAFRGVLGHEFVGEVVWSKNSDLAGKRVVGEINAGCGVCTECTRGMARHCPNRTVMGILGRDGAFAEYLRLPDSNLVSLPDAIPDELAVFVEPLAAAHEIFEQIEIDRDQRIAILGDGRLGAMVGLALSAAGLEPVIGGHHRDKLDRLAAFGLKVELEENLAGGFDLAIDCTGSSTGLSRAIALVRPRGRLVLKSTAAIAATINLAPLVVNEITVIGSRCGRFAPAIAALAAGKVDPRPLISAIYSLDHAPAAFAAAADPSNFKVLLNPR